MIGKYRQTQAEDFVDIFGGRGGLVLRVVSFLCILESFLKVNLQNEDFLLLLEFQISFGVCLIFQILVVNILVDAVSKRTYKEK